MTGFGAGLGQATRTNILKVRHASCEAFEGRRSAGFKEAGVFPYTG